MKWWQVFIAFGLMACGNGRDGSNDELAINETIIDKLSLEDSLFMQSKIKEFNADYFEGRSNDFGGWLYEDSEMKLFKKVNFKVFNFLGEWVGAYGSPMYVSYIIDLNQNDTLHLNVDSSLFNIDTVIQLDEKHFFIHSKGPIRARGLEYIYCEESSIYNSDTKKLRRIAFSKFSMLIDMSEGNETFISNGQLMHNWSKNSNQLSVTSYDYEWGTEWTDSMVCKRYDKIYFYKDGMFTLTHIDSTIDIRRDISQE